MGERLCSWTMEILFTKNSKKLAKTLSKKILLDLIETFLSQVKGPFHHLNLWINFINSLFAVSMNLVNFSE